MARVVMSGQQLLSDLDKSEIIALKKDLTFDNPAYKQAKAFSKFQYTSIDPYLYYYKKYGDSFAVPRGYKPPFEVEIESDVRSTNKVIYPKFKWELRDMQREAFEAWDRDRRSGLIVMQTGKGKSILGCYLASESKQKTLIIVQKNDLIVSWTKDIKDTLSIPKDQLGLIKAKSKTMGKQITLATIQTINKLKADEVIKLTQEFGMVIVDEVHHSPAKSYNILNACRAKYLIGLTATDKRGDGLDKVMPLQFGDIIFRGEELGEDDPDILPVNVVVRPTNLAFIADVKYKHKGKIVLEKEAKQLMAMGYRPQRLGMDAHARDMYIDTNIQFADLIIDDILTEVSNEKSCIVFFKKHVQLDLVYMLLEKKGMDMSRVGKYVGGLKDDGEYISKAESKEIIVTLATLKKATEGTNVKAWERVFLASSLKQQTDVIQAVGRGRRTKEGKDDVIVFDYRHPMVDGLRSHEAERDKAYKKLKAKVKRIGGKVMTRGFL